MGPDQTAPTGTVCSGSTMFVFIIKSSVMLGIYLRRTSSDAFFSGLFLAFWGLRINLNIDACICLVNEHCGNQFILLSIYIVTAKP